MERMLFNQSFCLYCQLIQREIVVTSILFFLENVHEDGEKNPCGHWQAAKCVYTQEYVVYWFSNAIQIFKLGNTDWKMCFINSKYCYLIPLQLLYYCCNHVNYYAVKKKFVYTYSHMLVTRHRVLIIEFNGCLLFRTTNICNTHYSTQSTINYSIFQDFLLIMKDLPWYHLQDISLSGYHVKKNSIPWS
jgi:hypothetical protein